MTPRDAWMHTAKREPRICPVCHATLDAATSVSLDPNDRAPEMTLDSITTCAECGTILVVTTIGFRLATDEDLAHVDPEARKLTFAFSEMVQQARQDRRRRKA